MLDKDTKEALNVLGSVSMLAIGAWATYYFMPDSWWPKRFADWYWTSLVTDVKEHWQVILIIVGIVLFFMALNAWSNYRNPPRRYTMEDLEDW